jgi:hypothetical protein
MVCKNSAIDLELTPTNDLGDPGSAGFMRSKNMKLRQNVEIFYRQGMSVTKH